eukprot:884764-Prorocentrum_minimum.AAC.2
MECCKVEMFSNARARSSKLPRSSIATQLVAYVTLRLTYLSRVNEGFPCDALDLAYLDPRAGLARNYRQSVEEGLKAVLRPRQAVFLLPMPTCPIAMK